MTEPYRLVQLAEHLKHTLTIEERSRIALIVTREEWDALAKYITQLQPIMHYPPPDKEPPSRIQLLGISVLVGSP